MMGAHGGGAMDFAFRGGHLHLYPLGVVFVAVVGGAVVWVGGRLVRRIQRGRGSR